MILALFTSQVGRSGLDIILSILKGNKVETA